MTDRRLTLTDQLLATAQRAARVLGDQAQAERPNPAGALIARRCRRAGSGASGGWLAH